MAPKAAKAPDGCVALWIAAWANTKEVIVRAGHTLVAFTLNRCGHLFPGHDEELREELRLGDEPLLPKPDRALLSPARSSTAQVIVAVVLSVVVHWRPFRTAVNGTLVARPGGDPV